MCQETLFISCQLGLYWNTTKGWLTIFSLQDPPLHAPAHPCWPRARCFGEQRISQVSRQAESWLGNCVPQVHPLLCLAPRVSTCGQIWEEMSWTGSLPIETSSTCFEVPPGQRRERLSPTGPGRNGSPEWRYRLGLVGWERFEEIK